MKNNMFQAVFHVLFCVRACVAHSRLIREIIAVFFVSRVAFLEQLNLQLILVYIVILHMYKS